MNKYLIIVGTACSCLWGFITWMTFGIPESWCRMIDQATFHVMTREVFQMTNGFYYDVRNNDMPTIIFLLLFGIIFTLVFMLMKKVEQKKPDKYSLGIIVVFAILFRVIILPGELIHENDIYRYIWDGKSTLNKINPYKYAPADVFMHEHGYEEDYYDEDHEVTIRGKHFDDRDDWNLAVLQRQRDENLTFFERIGHWEVPTIYPPVAQVLFVLPVFINSDSIIFMKFFFVLFDFGSLFLIIGLLGHFKKNPCMSIVYGWSPLVLFEIANGGHYDSIAIFFTLLGMLLFVKRRQWGGTCALAFATLSKFFSVVLLPILARPFKKRYIFLFTTLIFIFYLPFILWDHTGINGVFQGLMTYNRQWSYNASIFALVYIIIEKISPDSSQIMLTAKGIVGVIYLIILSFLVFKKSKNDLDIVHKCFWAIAALFIINPVADPWYYCWVIPFLCLFPYRSWYLLSGLLMLGYLNFHSDIGIVDAQFWKIPVIGWLTYVPFFLYWVIEAIWKPKFQMNSCKDN